MQCAHVQERDWMNMCYNNYEYVGFSRISRVLQLFVVAND